MSVAEKLTAIADAIREQTGDTAKLSLDDMPVAIRSFGNQIVVTATGETIVLTDSADAKLKGLTVYGKTTQNGTPTPEAPVELVSAGEDGGVDVSVVGKNIIDIYGFSATSIYTPNETRELSNNYGTTISTIDPSERLVVSQTKTDQPNNPESYKNGYFVVCIKNKLHAGDNISFSFDLDITDNPLNPDSILILGNGVSIMYALNICGNRWGGILKWEEYQERNYIEIRAMGLSGVFSNFQLELNDGCTEYEPYKPSQTLTVSTPNGLAGIPVTSGGNYTDSNGQQWICDEVDFARGVYVQRISVKTLTDFSNSGGHYVWPSGFTEGYAFIGNYVKNNTGLCSHFVFAVSGEFSRFAPNQNVVYFVIPGNLSQTEWRNKMTEIAPTVCCALENPIETPLSAEQLEAYAALHTNYPTTTIMNDSGAGMSVSYVASTKNYIDNQVAAVSAAILNL